MMLETTFQSLSLIFYFQIWTRFPFFIIVIILAIFPLLIGCRYFMDPCLFYFYESSCIPFVNNYYTFVATVNIAFCCTTLIIIFIGLLLARKHNIMSNIRKKIEQRLVWQTASSSVLLILYYTCNVITALTLPTDPHTGLKFQILSSYIYSLHTYPPIILLFFISSAFRENFSKFYGLNKISELNKVKDVFLTNLHNTIIA